MKTISNYLKRKPQFRPPPKTFRYRPDQINVSAAEIRSRDLKHVKRWRATSKLVSMTSFIRMLLCHQLIPVTGPASYTLPAGA